MKYTIIILIGLLICIAGCEVDPERQKMADNRELVTRVKIEGDEGYLDKYLLNATATEDTVQLAVQVIQHYHPSDPAWVIVAQREAIQRYHDLDYPVEDYIVAMYIADRQDSVMYRPENYAKAP